mgnify:CR=1 FL=1
MDAMEQKNGERRVREVLVEPLERLGLMKPAGHTKAQFEAMKEEICQRLAYMGEVNLAGLCEELAGCGGGKDRDRFPLATVVLPLAMRHQPPKGDASPLMRAVFAHAVGEAALAQGYAPELMKWLRDNRKFPGPYVIGQIADMGRDAARRAQKLQEDSDAGRGLSDAEAAWLINRRAVIERCETARKLGMSEGAST